MNENLKKKKKEKKSYSNNRRVNRKNEEGEKSGLPAFYQLCVLVRALAYSVRS